MTKEEKAKQEFMNQTLQTLEISRTRDLKRLYTEVLKYNRKIVSCFKNSITYKITLSEPDRTFHENRILQLHPPIVQTDIKTLESVQCADGINRYVIHLKEPL